MSELFDMVSGTSTGSLLAAAIVLPNKSSDPLTNYYYASDGVDVYSEFAPKIFQKNDLKAALKSIAIAGSALFGALIGYLLGINCYKNKQQEDTLKAFKAYIKSRKLIKKGKQENAITSNSLEEALARIV